MGGKGLDGRVEWIEKKKNNNNNRNRSKRQGKRGAGGTNDGSDRHTKPMEKQTDTREHRREQARYVWKAVGKRKRDALKRPSTHSDC